MSQSPDTAPTHPAGPKENGTLPDQPNVEQRDAEQPAENKEQDHG